MSAMQNTKKTKTKHKIKGRLISVRLLHAWEPEGTVYQCVFFPLDCFIYYLIKVTLPSGCSHLPRCDLDGVSVYKSARASTSRRQHGKAA